MGKKYNNYNRVPKEHVIITPCMSVNMAIREPYDLHTSQVDKRIYPLKCEDDYHIFLNGNFPLISNVQ